MDWTTPLKFQQNDFIQRLKKQKALEHSMLESKVRGSYSEMITFHGEPLEKIQTLSQIQAEKIANTPPEMPQNYDSWRDFREHFQEEAYEYSVRESLVDNAIEHCFGKQLGKLSIDAIENMELDAEGNLHKESKFRYFLSENPPIKIQVHVCDHESFNSLKKDKVRWSVTQDDLKNNRILVFMCLLGLCCTDRGAEIESVFTGFTQTEQIAFSGPKTHLKLADFLYIGGLGYYLSSFTATETLAKEQILIPENPPNLEPENYPTTVVNGWKFAYNLTGHTTGINSLAINPTGTILASGSRGEIRLWDLITGQLISALSEYPWVKSWEINEVNCLAFSPDGYTLVSGGMDTTLKIWHTGAKDLIDILEQHNGIVRCLTFSPSGQLIASGGDDRKIYLWNRLQREASSAISWGDGVPHSLAFSPNGLELASGSYRKIKVWRLSEQKKAQPPNAKLLLTLTAHSHIVTAVVFCPDHQTLLSGSRDGTIKLWHLETGELIRTFKEETGAIHAIALSPDGETIASGSEDKTVRLWHLSSGKLDGTFTGHSLPVNAVAFTPDGQTLVSASQDKTIKIWQRV